MRVRLTNGRKRQAHRHAQPRKRFYVDLEMCGGANFLDDFDLEEFCSILQALVPKVQVVPVTDPARHARNRAPRLVSEALFNEAIGQYCHR